MQTLSKQSQQFRHAASQNLYTYDVRLERSSHHLLPLTARRSSVVLALCLARGHHAIDSRRAGANPKVGWPREEERH